MAEQGLGLVGLFDDVFDAEQALLAGAVSGAVEVVGVLSLLAETQFEQAAHGGVQPPQLLARHDVP